MKSTMKNMVVSLTVIAVTMGAVLAAVHEITAKPIAEAAVKAKNEAMAAVLPPFDNDPSASPQSVTVDGDSRPVIVYTASEGGKVSGYAVETWTLDGFSGEITIMVGFDPSGAITGYEVLTHAETPGLGAKANEWFRIPGTTRNIIGTTSPLSVSKDGGEIDGITAATITSRAFLSAVNRARQAIKKELEVGS